MERLFLAAKGFNTNLLQFLSYRVIIINVLACSQCTPFPMYTDVHLNWFYVHKILCTRNIIYEGLCL